MSASATNSNMTPMADDTVNIPYNPSKQPQTRSDVSSRKKATKTNSMQASSIMDRPSLSLSLLDPPAPMDRLSELSTLSEPPAPPPAPRYCTRQTTKQMQATANAVTKEELAKLHQTKQLASSHVQQMDHTTNLHEIMYKYADRQQTLCTQLCDLNTRLQARQDEIVQLRNAKHDAEDDIEHYKGVADSYEEDIQVLTEERDQAYETRDSYLLALEDANQARKAVQTSIPGWCMFVCLVMIVCGLHINYEYNLDIQQHYANMVHFLKIHYWTWITTCLMEEGNAAERHNARGVPGI